MNKGELVSDVAKRCNITKKEAEVYVTAVFDGISESLIQEEKVQIPSFGTFELKYRGERILKSPRTGEEMVVAPVKVPSFKVSKMLKDKVNGK